jgi:hypothetical protein
MIDNIEDYVDLAEEQGWCTRRTTTGYQFFPPRGAIVTLLASYAGRAGDPNVLRNWRAQLRRAGLQIPEDVHKPKAKTTMTTDGTNGKHAPPPAAATPATPATAATATELSLAELFVLAEKRLDAVLNECAALQGVLAQIRQRSEKNERLRAVLRELQA